jgi:hypothetical protein
MVKRIGIILTMVVFGFAAYAQTYATDFTADDCDGVSHNLFSELDNGKVVVLAWTMPCFSCIAPCVTAQDAVNSFGTSNPGEVVYYIIDDYADTDCASLDSWVATNVSHQTTCFSDASIDMLDYGTTGMPKVVVLGCADAHRIFYNQNNSVDYTEIVNAISDALDGSDCSLGIEDETYDFALDVYPNPVGDVLNISYTLESATSVNIQMMDITGAAVNTKSFNNQSAGKQIVKMDTDGLSNGVYFVKITSGKTTKTKKIVVSK